MEFKLKQICLAVGLPFLAFLSLYWLKQRKKIGDGCADERRALGAVGAVGAVGEQADPKSGDQTAQSPDDAGSRVNADQSNSGDRQNESTVESQSTNSCAARDACCKAGNRESIDQDKAINSTDNQTPVQPSKPASLPDDSPVKLNNNDNDFKSKDPTNDSQTASKPAESKPPESKSPESKSPESKSPESKSPESKSLRSDLTNDTFSSADKLDSADHPENRQQDDRSANQSTSDAPPTDLNKLPANEEASELHSSSKSLAEGEEMFETNISDDPTRHRRQSLNSSTANTSTMNNESAKADTTALTFDTARDLSINDSSVRLDDQSIDQSLNAGHSFANADESSIIDYVSSANATVNSSIRSLKDSTLGSINCSAKTLHSPDDSKRDADQPDDSKPKIELLSSETSNAADTSVHKEEEVKGDYLNATAVNRSNRSLNSTANNSAVDDIDSASLQSEAKPSDSRSEVEETVEEKHLNVTEAEFKNDTVSQVVQELQAEVVFEADQDASQNETIKKDEESGIEEATKTEENDDSIIFDCVVSAEDRKTESRPACKAKPAQNGLANEPENATKESASKESAAKENSPPKPAVNLDDSDDVQIVFETCEDIKPKQLPKVNGRTAKAREEKTGSVAGTPSKAAAAMNQQVPPSNHAMDEFTFEIPMDLCGLLIGTKGGFINPTMRQTNTSITLLNHPTLRNMSLCSIKGHYSGINEALAIIRERFPFSRFPQVTLMQTPNLVPVETISETAQLHLPEGVSCDVILSDFVSPKHLFLQQPTHASFHLLQRLDDYMISTYFHDTPTVDDPAVGIICAVQRGEGWFRAIVTDCSGPIKVRLLDYGGYVTVPKTALRQVQRDMMSLPFQAAECMLANVEPANGVWTAEAHNYFRSVTEKQFLQAFIVDYTEERIPKIELYRIVDKHAVLINKEIIDNGFAVFAD